MADLAANYAFGFAGRFLIGGVVLGCIVAFWFGNFVGRHPLVSLVIAHGYLLLVIFGAYKKYQSVVDSEQGNYGGAASASPLRTPIR
jgi:hypothetical protein